MSDLRHDEEYKNVLANQTTSHDDTDALICQTDPRMHAIDQPGSAGSDSGNSSYHSGRNSPQKRQDEPLDPALPELENAFLVQAPMGFRTPGGSRSESPSFSEYSASNTSDYGSNIGITGENERDNSKPLANTVIKISTTHPGQSNESGLNSTPFTTFHGDIV